MQQIKIFKSNNKKILSTQNEINNWLEDEECEVHSINTVNGLEYKSNAFSNFDEIEIFFIVLYSK